MCTVRLITLKFSLPINDALFRNMAFVNVCNLLDKTFILTPFQKHFGSNVCEPPCISYYTYFRISLFFLVAIWRKNHGLFIITVIIDYTNNLEVCINYI